MATATKNKAASENFPKSVRKILYGVSSVTSFLLLGKELLKRTSVPISALLLLIWLTISRRFGLTHSVHSLSRIASLYALLGLKELVFNTKMKLL